MRKVPTNDYKLYIPWARENTANSIYPCSIAEGLQPGNIYVVVRQIKRCTIHQIISGSVAIQ